MSLSRFAMIALLGSAALPAATITSYSLSVNGGGISQGAGNVGFQDSGYSVEGTLGLYDQSSTLLTDGSTFQGPFAFRLTDTTINCVSSCQGLAFFLSVSIFFDGEAPFNADGVFGVEGTGTGAAELAAYAQGSDVLPLFVSTFGNFSDSVYLPSGFLQGNGNGSSMQLTIVSELGAMGDGESISLPNSLFQQVNVADDSSVPEPGTLAIVGAGLAGALWFRRRSAQRTR